MHTKDMVEWQKSPATLTSTVAKVQVKDSKKRQFLEYSSKLTDVTTPDLVSDGEPAEYYGTIASGTQLTRRSHKE